MKDYDFIDRSCLSKNSYESLARANMELARAKKHKRNKSIHVYKCLFDEHYHLGHTKST